MNEKKISNNPAVPSADELAQRLAEIEMATIEEEQERAERGLTQEPEAVRLKRESANAGEIRNSKTPTEQLEFGGGMEETVRDWLVQNQSEGDGGYLFENMDPQTPIKYDIGAPDIPPQFIDHLIGIAKKKASNNSYFKDIQTIKVYSGDNKIALGLRNSDDQLTRLYFRPTPPFELFYFQR